MSGRRCAAASAISAIRPVLPQCVLRLLFTGSSGDVFGIIHGFTADGFPDRELRDVVDGVRSGRCATTSVC